MMIRRKFVPFVGRTFAGEKIFIFWSISKQYTMRFVFILELKTGASGEQKMKMKWYVNKYIYSGMPHTISKKLH